MGCKRDRLLLPDLQQMLANKQLLMLAEERVASKVQGEQWYITPPEYTAAKTAIHFTSLFLLGQLTPQ